MFHKARLTISFIQAPPLERSEVLSNVTSTPSALVASELVVVSVIIENLASIAASNPKVIIISSFTFYIIMHMVSLM